MVEINGVTADKAETLDGEFSVLVSDELREYWNNRRGVMDNSHRLVADVEKEVVANEWLGIGYIANPDQTPVPAGTTLDDYGSSRGVGRCLHQIALETANSEEIEERFSHLNGGNHSILQWDGMFLYNIGDKSAVQLVKGIEQSLSDYPLLNEERFSELELELSYETFVSQPFPDMDATIDIDRLWEQYREMFNEDYFCPECGTRDVEEVLEEYYKQCENTVCDAWFDPEKVESGKNARFCIDVCENQQDPDE